MATQENIKLCRKSFEEIYNQGKLDAADQIYATTYVDHDPFNPGDVGKGPQAVKKLATMYRKSFPDLKMKIEDQFGDADRVVTRWTAEGTHKAEFMGIRATSKRIRVPGITIDRVQNAKIVESWSCWDTAGFLEQLGVSTSQPRAAAFAH